MADKVTLNEMTFKKMINKDVLDRKIIELANQINTHYKGEFLEIIVVLKGAFIFAADLIRHLDVDHAIHFVQFSSYEGMQSQNKIVEKVPLDIDVKGRNLIIIEDIIDTGNTLQYFIEKLKLEKPKSLEVAVLLFKPNAFQHDYPIRFKAFDIKNEFVIGYGMDLDESARNLKHIYQLDK